MTRPVLDQPREDLALQHLERFRIAEEGRDADQHVLIEGLGLGGIALEEPRVLLQPLHLVQHRPSRDAAEQRVPLVAREIHPGGHPQLFEHAV